VLSELLAGHRPFDGGNAAQLFEAVLLKDPAPLPIRPEEPRLSGVERILCRMLEKSPAARFADLRVVGTALAAAQRGEALRGLREEAAAPVLAVTDFRNISANAEDDWLGTGISETVTADLGGFEGVTMVPRGRVSELARTVERLDGDPGDLFWIRIGRELGATWVLNGSFQRAGDALRVTALLLDIATGHVERTIKVDGRMDGIFALQDRLVRELADLLRAVIRRSGEVKLETGVVGAYEAYSKGVINLRAESYESLDRAAMLFEQAVELDPSYARAHLELGVAYGTKAAYLARNELRGRAVASLRRAIELQPDSVRAWRELGSVLILMNEEGDGFDALRRALQIDPADAGALGAMARGLFIGRGQFDEAASWYERALAVNPKAGWYSLQLAHCAALLRDFSRGEAAAHRAVRLQQTLSSGQEGVLIVGASMRLGHLHASQGRSQEAIAAYVQELEFLNGIDHALRNRVIVELNVRLGAAYLSIGEGRKGRALLDVAIEAFDRRVRLGADEPFTRYYAAAAHALKGDADTAIAFIERAAAERRAFTLERARIEPEFDALRRDPRLQRLLQTD
jgi:tetratricopeptide (TPR) repeat protein